MHGYMHLRGWGWRFSSFALRCSYPSNSISNQCKGKAMKRFLNASTAKWSTGKHITVALSVLALLWLAVGLYTVGLAHLFVAVD
jgi:hypothetical protein